MECSISVLMKIRVMSPLNALDAMVQYQMDDSVDLMRIIVSQKIYLLLLKAGCCQTRRYV